LHSVSVVIADRHPVVLLGLTKLLGPESGFRIIAACSDGTSCIEAIRHLLPDIAIVDIAMPRLTGLDILSIANSEKLPTRLVFLTSSIEDRERAMSATDGAYGIIPREVTPDILVESLRRVANGQKVLPLLASAEAEVHERGHIPIVENALSVLTERERQIMNLVSEGLSNKEIGRRLNIADGTIKVHLHHIFQKLEISNRTELAALAIANQ
jgi:two-component system nitrate/nitrite response regulator NarL